MKSGIRITALLSLLILAGAGLWRSVRASGSVTYLTVTDRALLRRVTRLGINLGDQDFYDSGQMTRNLLYRNPGFEGMVYRSIFHCQKGGESSCVDSRQGIRFPDEFWAGASYRVIDGSAAGRTGSVIAAAAEAQGYALHLDFRKKPLADGDWMVLEKRFPADPAAGWWPVLKGGAQLAAERTDLPPGSQGQQALRMEALRPGQSAEVNSYFDTTPDISFVRLHGTYRLSFRAKALRGGAVLRVHVGRNAPGLRRYLARNVPLKPVWSNYSEEFTADEAGLPAATAEAGFAISGGSALLDDVALVREDRDPANHTAFRDAVVNTLKQLHPGVLRMMASGAGIGSTIDNLLAPPMARQRSGYRLTFQSVDDIPVGIPEFLELCREVGAEPWIVIPTAITPEGTRKLAQYLGGSAATEGGALRASGGQTRPWTQIFPTIHIELGNETWNPIFAGESIEDPAAYGRRADAVFHAFRAAAGPAAAHLDLVVGTNVRDPGRNRALLAAAPSANTLAIAPYLMMSLTQWGNDDQLYGPLLAQPEQMSRNGYVARSAASAGGRQMAVYEVNLHTTGGDPPQEVLDRFPASDAAGIAVADHMLRMMRDHRVRDEMLFSLPQYRFQRGDGKTVPLWGGAVIVGERNRPQLLAEMLANRVIGGDLLEVDVSGENPTRDQPAGNDGVRLPGMHEIDAYAFRNGARHGLIVFNLSLHQFHRVNVQGTGLTPSSSLHLEQLLSARPGDTNEQTQQVRIIAGDGQKPDLLLPPCSMTVLMW